MHALTIIRTYLKLGILNVLQYRADFFLQLLSLGIGLVTALLGISIVFQQTDAIGGWTSDDLIVLIGIQFLVRGLVQLIIQPSMENLMEGIRLGTLDFLLTKPADSQLLASVSRVNVAPITDVLVGFAILVVGIARLGSAISVGEALIFIVMLICGAVIVYSFLLMLSTLAFWFVRLDNVLVIFHTMFNGAGGWPITIYPGWLRVSLTFLVPVAFAITIPAESLTGRLDATTLLGTLALAAAFTVGSRLFWRLGLKNYTGASA